MRSKGHFAKEENDKQAQQRHMQTEIHTQSEIEAERDRGEREREESERSERERRDTVSLLSQTSMNVSAALSHRAPTVLSSSCDTMKGTAQQGHIQTHKTSEGLVGERKQKTTRRGQDRLASPRSTRTKQSDNTTDRPQ